MAEQKYDVTISGAGPVGLVLAYHLTRLGHSVCIFDAADKAAPGYPMYGRAAVLYSRTLELLDQLGLYDDLCQTGVTSDQTFAYKDGEAIARKWAIFDAPESQIHTTFFHTIMYIRLKHSEDIFRHRLAELGVQVLAPAVLVGLHVNPAALDDYQVTANIKAGDAPNQLTDIRSRYIVGCDGAGSAVRRLAGIPFAGERKIQYWVRIDGVVKTNVPNARLGLGAFESSTHGHVVWMPLDNGATRTGFVLNDQLLQKYGTKMSAQDAAYEAQQAVAPFELEWERIDWHTVYGIQQHVAESFYDRGGRVLLAGDAGHTLCSGSGQGMNAGIQDAMSLSWRLSGTLKLWYRPGVLESYSDERRTVAQQLIDNDKTITELMSQRKPVQFQNRSEPPYVLLDEYLRLISGFTIGLSISYPAGLLNDVDGSELGSATAARPGQRLPDALLQRSGVAEAKIRLFDIIRNNGKFRILVLAGGSAQTSKDALRMLRDQVDASLSTLQHVVDFVTVVPGSCSAFDERLGVQRFGKAYRDPDLSAHARFGVSTTDGAIIVLRPDDMIGLVVSLGGFRRVIEYFERFLDPARTIIKS